MKLLRSQNNLTQKQVAEYLRCAVSTYGKYETGEREPSISVLISLADLYGVSVDELLGHIVCVPAKFSEIQEPTSAASTSSISPISSTSEDSPEIELAHLKHEFDLERAQKTQNHILIREVDNLREYYDILLVKDIYAKIDYLLNITTVKVTDMVKIFCISKSGDYHWLENGDMWFTSATRKSQRRSFSMSSLRWILPVTQR